MSTGIYKRNILGELEEIAQEHINYWCQLCQFPLGLERCRDKALIQKCWDESRSVAILKSLPIPLSPLNEQYQIIQEIERHFSVADQIEKVTEQSIKQSERLRQSILKKAFEGKLVPQDPDDEPAEKLLERIKAEKARQQAGAVAARARNRKILAQRS